MWRSLVAYTPGGRGVAGSNPVISTKKAMCKHRFFCFNRFYRLFTEIVLDSISII